MPTSTTWRIEDFSAAARAAFVEGERRGSDEGFGANMLRHEFGMLPQPIAGSFDLHDDGITGEFYFGTSGENSRGIDIENLSDTVTAMCCYTSIV